MAALATPVIANPGVNSLGQNEVGFSLDFKVSTSCSPLVIDVA